MRQSLRFNVEETEADERLDRFLAARLGRLSRMHINSLLDEGACLVNKEAGRPGLHLQSGDIIEITLDQSLPTSMTPEFIPLDLLYEDAHLLVINKPAGMLVHPTRGEKSGTLSNALSYHLNRREPQESDEDETAARDESVSETNQAAPGQITQLFVRPGIVHRLDRDTSGLMVIAKHQRALTVLSSHFHRRLVEKRYLALVHGAIADSELVINAPIGRLAEAVWPRWRVLAEGKHAETRLRVMERRERTTLVELEPVTGRTNQLRIHCAHAGHAIVGDRWYGHDDTKRLCLHAARLAFHHPANGDWLEFRSPLPAEIEKQG